ncbi:MAG: polC [Patescibacteria group bacterium]|nr:polC [Patescibacteria group bacterium]
MSNALQQPLAFVDIETTGGSHFSSRVLEVGVVRVEHNQVVATYRTLIQPDEAIPPFITGLTGIRDEDVAGSPRFAQIASDLAEILDGAVFVAHNVRFDYSFLKMEFERLGVPFRPQLLCTVRLSRRLFPQFRTHKLQDLIERHGLNAPARHRAYDDAHCLWQFYQLCLAEFDLDTFEAAVRAQLAAQSLPSQLDKTQVDALPEGPGVYVFEDAGGEPLYVGKSVTVRRRVMSHFAADYGRAAEQKLAQRVRRLRGIATHGELSALLLESELIKDLQPLYNRALRQRERLTLAVAATTPEGYAGVALLDAPEIAPEDGRRLLAVYTTQGRARQSLHAAALRYRLCPKLMGLERTERACFQSQLGKCDGACVGRETPAAYNERFAAAFVRQRVVAWPYPGPVLIREQRAELPGATGFVVDNWCLTARLRELEDGTVETDPEAHRFDLDRYKIIRRFLEDPRNRRAITPLSSAQAEALMPAA